MTMVEMFVKERNEALFSLDRKRIEAFSVKYCGVDDSETPDEIFWAGVYKAILGVKCAPPELVQKARTWLLNNGYHAS